MGLAVAGWCLRLRLRGEGEECLEWFGLMIPYMCLGMASIFTWNKRTEGLFISLCEQFLVGS